MFYYGIDWKWIVMVLPTVLFALWASFHVKRVFKKYGQIRNMRGLTGAQAAQAVLSANGVSGVRIERVAGDLTDHYDPKSNVIRLSESVYDAPTPAAVGVAAHEAGHAVQYAEDYAPIKLRAAIIGATNIGSKLSMPLIIIGILLMSITSLARYQRVFYYIALAGVFCYGLCVLFQLLTLPTEFNASRRAVKAIETTGMLTADEQKGARKVLSAAALTYVAALVTTLAQFLRLLMLVSGSRRRN